MKKTLPSTETTYESAFAELQQIVRRIQDDQVSVDEMTALLARANALVQFCRDALRRTEEELGKG